jgi:hypothetical protein
MSASRRGFLTGLAGFLAAPAIVRASSLMPVKAVHELVPLVPFEFNFERRMRIVVDYRREFIKAFEEQYAHLRATRVEIVRNPRFEVVSA